MTEDKTTKGQRLRAIVKKPFVRVGLTLAVVTYSAFALLQLLVVIYLIYLLGQSVGIPTLQLVASVVSAVSAVASATAAILIWRGNVRTRKSVLLDRVLGPAYSETRRNRELLEAWKSDAKDVAPATPFLNQVSSDWLYYTLDPPLRTRLEGLPNQIRLLEEQRDLCRKVAGPIILKAAKDTFEIKDASTVYLWRSHTWKDGQVQGDNGRMPIWELIIDSPPLAAPPGYNVHVLQVVDFNSIQQFVLPLLSEKGEQLNSEKFNTFWELARKTAGENPTIISFREARQRTIESSRSLERELDSQMKRFR